MDKQELYVQEFSQVEKTLPGSRLKWLREARQAAMAHFAERGFPTAQDEEWRFTSLSPIVDGEFKLATKDGVGSLKLRGESLETLCSKLYALNSMVFVNGHYAPKLSSVRALPSGVKAGDLASLLATDPSLLATHLSRTAAYGSNTFAALNTALMQDGAFIYVPKGVILETPIYVLFLSTAAEEPTVSYPRVLVVTEANTKVVVVESYVGLDESAYFTNAVSEIVLGENAILEHYKLQRESKNAFHIATVRTYQDRNSNFTSHSFSFGGALVRNDINAVLDAKGAECALNGLYVATAAQHVDNHTVIDHAKPHGTSRELYKGVLAGKARGVFNGKIIVRPNAQKTDAMQTNKNLLLSDECLVNTKPQLEIFANDVKCKHGATIGQISPEVLFYLRSRGIDRESARRMLIHAFASAMLNPVKLEPLKSLLEQCITEQVPACPDLSRNKESI